MIQDKVNSTISRIECEVPPLRKILETERNGGPVSVVVIPSLSIEGDLLTEILAISHYETRSLWQILRSVSDNVEVIFVSSCEIFKEGIEHLLSFFPEKDKMRLKVHFLSLDDDSSELFLTDKILRREDIKSEIKKLIEKRSAYMTAFISTESEVLLARELGIPLYGIENENFWYQSKSGNHEIFKEAKSIVTDAIVNLHSVEEVAHSVRTIWQRNQSSLKYMVKLDHGVSGKGNAILNLDKSWKEFEQFSEGEQFDYILHRLRQMNFQGSDVNWSNFSRKFSGGVIIEKFILGAGRISPSCQGLITCDGEVKIISTHEQILDDSGMVFLGSEFPANCFLRRPIQDETLRVGKVMAEKGIIGNFALDFLIANDESGEIKNYVIEINLRQGGTTHPYEAANYITGSRFCEERGILIDDNGRDVYYRSNDNFYRSALVGKSFANLLKKVEEEGLIYDKVTGAGVVFHMMTALYKFGKLGYTAIGKSREEAQNTHEKIKSLLENF